MKTIIKHLLVIILFTNYAIAQEKKTEQIESKPLKTYVIEREIPNAGLLSAAELKGISQTSSNVIDDMGNAKIQWLHSYVTDDKVFCVYKAVDKDAINEHAKKGGFPVNAIRELSAVINPETAKQ
ncbi:DUF4242 domain-containing protein [Confluentibacter citreus]|uniref:DUF4242 domain-containing protein n=1 Tax=Confluentibacter citreus TaxID=2007307 RepID=UPI000C28B1B2|nr:DUF4242 domain-containing protein [Confluentibacter citreus]